MSPRKTVRELWAEAELRQLHSWGVKVTLTRHPGRGGYVCGDGEAAPFFFQSAADAIHALWADHQERRLRFPTGQPYATLRQWEYAWRRVTGNRRR